MKLHLYDFDGTLFKSPEYVPDWWKAPGEWSWFSNPASLTEPCIPLNPSSKWWIQSSVEDAKKSVQDKDTLTIICTGRVKEHKPRIQSLLDKAGIKGLYRMYFNPGISAAVFKVKVVEYLYKQYSFEEVHIWENENYTHYKEVIESKFGIPCVIHPVHEAHIDYLCTPQDLRLDGQDINITNEDQIIPSNALRIASTRREMMAIRVASRKIARMEKEAHFLSGVQNKLAQVLTLDLGEKMSKYTKKQSGTAKKGLAWALNSMGMKDLKKIMEFVSQNKTIDSKDPIQKMLAMRIKGINNPNEATEIVGSFISAFNNQDVEQMAKVMGVEEEVMALVLLSYTKGKQAKEEYNWGQHRLDIVENKTEEYLHLSANIIKKVNFITGGNAVEWLVKLFPKGELFAKPLKWGWWTLLITQRWSILSALTSIATSGLTSLSAWMVASGGFLNFLAVSTPFFINPFTITLGIGIFILNSIIPEMSEAELRWMKDKPSALLVPVKAIYRILKEIIKGTINVGKSAYYEIKEYISENAENFKNFLPNFGSDPELVGV